jgi:parvulin-like peptidyl-prolyl isomerase
MKRVFLAAIALLAFHNLHAEKDPVVATVNGKPIRKAYFDKVYRQNLLFISDKKVTPEKVMNDLINRELGIQKARNEKLHLNETVLEKIEDVIYHAQISKDLEKEFKNIKDISNEEVKQYYRNHPEYRTAHILFRVPVEPKKEQDDGALETAIKVYNQLKKKPERFPEFANKYSISGAARNGGDIGYQPAMRLAPQYYEAIKGQKNGFITPPVKTRLGYHIIQLLGVKSYADISKDAYKKIIYDIKRDRIINDYFAKLRMSAKVTVNKNLLN